ncbi:MAG: hypothetical protein HOG05_06810 [Bacteroidetes bacterium]|jgi:RHS repeat-associated protein|nr:hypothetical protein [Bacteroidota bacterium]MBT4729140.1 hypothetical protein [Bacteroidota bacterium]MBT5990608.1 hypothetical protein [Bacteroidota bacterium]MBT7826731.1 hypothetical protein [Bacteroidota bacterium]MBT7993916.1 hypothetical protein [Bacteroidota bacterium]
MGCFTLNILDGFPSKHSSQILMGSNWKPITKKGVSTYRFGFQGQEMDHELKGTGNSVNFKYRMHDPRLGRFFAVDPLSKEFAYNSPYAFCENKLGIGVELEGLEIRPYIRLCISTSVILWLLMLRTTHMKKFLYTMLKLLRKKLLMD